MCTLFLQSEDRRPGLPGPNFCVRSAKASLIVTEKHHLLWRKCMCEDQSFSRTITCLLKLIKRQIALHSGCLASEHDHDQDCARGKHFALLSFLNCSYQRQETCKVKYSNEGKRPWSKWSSKTKVHQVVCAFWSISSTSAIVVSISVKTKRIHWFEASKDQQSDTVQEKD